MQAEAVTSEPEEIDTIDYGFVFNFATREVTFPSGRTLVAQSYTSQWVHFLPPLAEVTLGDAMVSRPYKFVSDIERTDMVVIRGSTLTGVYTDISVDLEAGHVSVTGESGPVILAYFEHVQSVSVDMDHAFSMFGSSGDETLSAQGTGAAELHGRDGNDILLSGEGVTILNGGEGRDTASYANAKEGVRINLNAGLANASEGEVQDRYISIERIEGSAFADTLLGSLEKDQLRGADGDDLIKGADGLDWLWGDGGNDQVHGELGDDRINGGTGDDSLFGDAGHDHLQGSDGHDALYGGQGNDALRGGKGDDLLWGNRDDDYLAGDNGADHLIGGTGRDLLSGGKGADLLEGGAGVDRLFGGAGDDVLWGGADTWDQFIYALGDVDVGAGTLRGGGGFDRIKDFSGRDYINLTSFGFSDFDADVLSRASEQSGGVRLDFGGRNVLFIEDFKLADFDASDVWL